MAAPAKSSPTFSKPTNLISTKQGIQQDAILKAYSESDWDQVTSQLEAYLRLHGDANVSKEERIFAYKYLGVVFAADTVTKARAESYFHRLLDLAPEIEILDMFASKKVTDLFDNLKAEHQKRLDYKKSHDQYGQVVGTTPSSGFDSLRTQRHSKTIPLPAKVGPKKDGGHAWVWWTAGTAVTAGAITGIYLLTSQSSESKTLTQTTNIDGIMKENKP
jgi:hypothetical protein